MAADTRSTVFVCPHCGGSTDPDARFCPGCGAPLGAGGLEHELRKTVTIVFCDVTGSTTLGERLDPEALRRVMGRYFAEMSAVLQSHGGTVEKFIGDAVMAVFGVPRAHEDDALRAVRAAAEMQVAIGRLNDDLDRDLGVRIAIRIGVNTGEVVAGDLGYGSSFATGDTVNVAARLEQAAAPGAILIGADTYKLVAHAVTAEPTAPLALAGKSEPLVAWRLVAVRRDAPAFERDLDRPLVGRHDELDALRTAFAQAVAEPGLRLVTIVGEPGIGKSRLLLEFTSALAEQARVLVGHCPPYGEGITYLPLAELVRDLTDGIPERFRALVAGDEQGELVVDVICGAVGLSERMGLTDETQWAVRRLFETLARERPLVVCLEDVHWAEPTFLQLVEYLVGCSVGAPILVVVAARDDLLELRPEWAHPRPNARTIVLSPLTEWESATLIAQQHDEQTLSPESRARIGEAAGGNPLFLQQLLSLHAQAGTVDLDVVVPPTIQALLTARIDRLSLGERAAIERASIEGRTFHRSAVTELLPRAERDAVGGHLVDLTRRDFIRAHRSTFPGDDGFRFTHALVRDAVYASMPKELRAELHARFARWLQKRLLGRPGGVKEIVGYHLEQAYRYRKEQGPMDDETRILAREAAELLADGGEVARLRGDMPAATNLLTRAAELLPHDAPERLRLLPDLAAAFLEGGEPKRAEDVLEDAVTSARAIHDDRLEAHARAQMLTLRYQLDPAFDWNQGLQQALALTTLFRSLGDEKGLASAWGVVGVLRMRLGLMDTAEEALEQAAEHARRAGDRFLESRMLLYSLSAKATGNTPVSDALAYGEALLAKAEEMPRNGLYARIWTARLLAMEGRFDEARTLFAEASARADALGHRWLQSWQPLIEAWVELLAGDARAAEQKLEASEKWPGSLGEGYHAGRLSRLADALYRQERLDDAAAALDEAEGFASSDPYARAHWDAVSAKIEARRGDPETAERLAREAVELLEERDDPDALGDVLVSLAEVLQLLERPEDARPVLERALALYQAKGNSVSAERTRSALGALTTKGRSHERAT